VLNSNTKGPTFKDIILIIIIFISRLSDGGDIVQCKIYRNSQDNLNLTAIYEFVDNNKTSSMKVIFNHSLTNKG